MKFFKKFSGENLLSTPWAVAAETLESIQFLNQYWKSSFSGLPVIKTTLKLKDIANTGLAVIEIHGLLLKKVSPFFGFLGATSTKAVSQEFREALGSEEVKAILLDIDSPGGTVDGTEALADLIFESRGKKPIVAFVNGLAASAAYWIASSADKILIEETGEAGSIGVVQIHYDYSLADEKAGVRRSMIYAGKYKTIGNNIEPLNDEARDVLQGQVDYMYSIFVNSVARNRGRSVKDVLFNMADGRLFIGEQARSAGLVDSIGSFNDAVTFTREKSFAGFQKKNQDKEEKVMVVKNSEMSSLRSSSQNRDFMSQVREYQLAHNCTLVESMKAVMKEDPKAHEDYIRKANPHRY